MNWRSAALLPLILALGACAEGGTRGSGISTTVLGNVVSAQAAAPPQGARTGTLRLLAELREGLHVERVAHAQSGIEGIRVFVEGTSAQGVTDANGAFSLHGDFDGLATLVFQLPDAGGTARLGINVPAAGTLTLNNVHIDVERGEAVAETQDVDFDGIITAINCEGLTLTMVSAERSPGDSDEYTLRLDTSSLQDAQGNPLTCGDLKEGEGATVQGKVNPDGTFGHATVEVGG